MNPGVQGWMLLLSGGFFGEVFGVAVVVRRMVRTLWKAKAISRACPGKKQKTKDAMVTTKTTI